MLTPGSIEMRPGAEIEYRLTLHGIPVRWLTEITAWEPGRRFVDEQRRGPYRLWHHVHTFEAVPGGTVIGDQVRYRLPLGMLGGVAHLAFLRRDLRRIFDFRQDAVARCLSGHRHTADAGV